MDGHRMGVTNSGVDGEILIGRESAVPHAPCPHYPNVPQKKKKKLPGKIWLTTSNKQIE
jgi:hypothetical protein